MEEKKSPSHRIKELFGRLADYLPSDKNWEKERHLRQAEDELDLMVRMVLPCLQAREEYIFWGFNRHTEHLFFHLDCAGIDVNSDETYKKLGLSDLQDIDKLQLAPRCALTQNRLLGLKCRIENAETDNFRLFHRDRDNLGPTAWSREIASNVHCLYRRHDELGAIRLLVKRDGSLPEAIQIHNQEIDDFMKLLITKEFMAKDEFLDVIDKAIAFVDKVSREVADVACKRGSFNASHKNKKQLMPYHFK